MKVWQPESVCSASSRAGLAAQCSVSELGGQYAQRCPLLHLDWQWPCRVVFNSTRRKLLISPVRFYQLFLQRRRRRRQPETWRGDECSHFFTFQKYSLSVRNGAACTRAEGKLPFPLTCSQGWESEWKAIWECLPSEVMNTLQIRGRGLSISSAVTSSILTALNCFLYFALFKPLSYFPSIFYPFIPSSFYIFSTSRPSVLHGVAAGFLVRAFGVDRLSSERSRGRERHSQIAGQKAETAWPSVRTQRAAGIGRPREKTEKRDLEPWAETKINTNPLTQWTQASTMCVCVYWHRVFCLK